GASHGIGVGSGTDALAICLRACGVGPGDAVITVAHTAIAPVAAISLCGATPILVDIDPHTYTMDPSSVEDVIKHLSARQSAIRKRLKAIIPVHLYGHPSDMEALISIASQNGLRLIEDCAQSLGAEYQGRRTGVL